MNQFDERFELNENAKENIIYNEHILRYELAKEFVKERTVLEIASGSGYGSNMLSQAGAKKIIAMDIDEKAVEKAQEKYKNDNLQFKIGDAEKIDLEDNTIEVLVSFETIEHLKKPKSFLSEAKRVLKENGILIVSTPNYEVSKNKNFFHEFEYTKEEFENVLKEKFRVVKIFEQGNVLASVIDLGAKRNTIYSSSIPKAQFFVAVCSNEEVLIPEKNFVGFNAKALERIYGNLKVMDAVYRVIVKVPGVKGLLELFRK